MDALSNAKIKNELAQLEFNWQLQGQKLVLEVKTKDFSEAAWVIGKVAKSADELNHHPDVKLKNYNQLTISTTTHDKGGLTDKDLALAELIDAVISRLDQPEI